MNIDRLIRDVEERLVDVDEAVRVEVSDAVREAIARERRHLGPAMTVETERERRRNAEELRNALEAIHRPTLLEEALQEVFVQLRRVVELDYAAVVSRDPGGGLRLLSAHGAEADQEGAPVTDPRLSPVPESRQPAIVTEADEEGTRPLPGAPLLRSWAALPLLLEGDVVGLLLAGRRSPTAFTAEETVRARAVAFWAAAALRRGQVLEQVKRYAALLEQVVEVDQKVFDGVSTENLAQAILRGACRVGTYPGGLLVLQTPRGPIIAATTGDSFAGAASRSAPAELCVTTARRLAPERMLEVAEALGTELPTVQAYLVPLATPHAFVGCLVLADPNGDSPDDRLMEAFASRAAAAWRHAAQHQESGT
jgi:hypothetical protein